MALNNSVRARIEKPDRATLPTIDPGQLPKTFGSNWTDPAFDEDQNKVQRLRGEETGRLLPASLPAKGNKDHLGPTAGFKGPGARSGPRAGRLDTFQGTATAGSFDGTGSAPASGRDGGSVGGLGVTGKSFNGTGGAPPVGSGEFVRAPRGAGFDDKDAPEVLTETAWRFRQAQEGALNKKARGGAGYSFGKPGQKGAPAGVGHHFHATQSRGIAGMGQGTLALGGSAPVGTEAELQKAGIVTAIDPKTGETIYRYYAQPGGGGDAGDEFSGGYGKNDGVFAGRGPGQSDLVSEMAPELGTKDKPLKFYAYFTEEIQESQVESTRVRKVVINYYHSDDTFMVQEPRIPNSGMVGGCLLKRQKVPLSFEDQKRRALTQEEARLPDLRSVQEKYASLLDLNIGQTVMLYSQRYHVFDCDRFTREFLGSLGITVPAAEPAPTDDYMSDFRPRRIDGSKLPASAATFDPAISGPALEAQRVDHEMMKQQRFVEDNGKVLCFRGYWKDPEERDALHACDVRFFVEDDTVAVVERPVPGTKAETALGTVVSRRRVPRPAPKARGGVMESPFLDGSDPKKPYLGLRDFYVGAELPMYGRLVVLYDCDGWTRDFFQGTYGVSLEPAMDISALLPVRAAKKVQPVPPPTGFGDDDDLASIRSLVLKPPRRKQQTEWSEHAGEMLRYRMKFHEPDRKEDMVREFVLTFHLDDGEIMVGELAGRNTGFTGGKFVKKQKLKKPVPPGVDSVHWQPEYFTLRDIYVGAVLRITGFQFIITEADEHTEAVLRVRAENDERAGNPAAPPKATTVGGPRVAQLLKSLADFITVRYYTATEAFRAFDKDHDRFVSFPELKEMLLQNQITFRDEEVVAVLRTLDTEGHGKISFKDFMAFIGQRMVPKKCDDVELADATATVQQMAELAKHLALRRRLTKLLKERLEGRFLNGFEMFRLLSTMPRAFKSAKSRGVEVAALTNVLKDSVVTPVQFRRGLTEILGLELPPQEMAVLLHFFFPDLPTAMYSAPIDRDTRYSVDMELFAARFVKMWSQELLDSKPDAE